MKGFIANLITAFRGRWTMNKKPPPPPLPEEQIPAEFQPVPPNASTYVQVCFWVAGHVKHQAERSEYTEDQLIEQFAMNIRKINNPDWKHDS